MAETQGHRLPDNAWFDHRDKNALRPGDYGRILITKHSGTSEEREEWDWFVCCPDGSTTVLWVNEDDRNGNRHVITEHEDGSITVGGSIMGHAFPSEKIQGSGPISTEKWHGWLERGVWRDA